MRELTEQEVSMVSGAMGPGAHSRPPMGAVGAPAHSPTNMPHLNLGSTLTCGSLGRGAGPIGGTFAAIGTMAATKNPEAAGMAYGRGKAVTNAAMSGACHYFMHQQGKR